MSLKKLATFTTTTSYQNVNTLLTAMSNNPMVQPRVFKDGAFRTAALAAYGVRISITQVGATTGDDNFSALYAPGEYMAFDQIDLRNVWIKSITGASTLEFEGSDI